VIKKTYATTQKNVNVMFFFDFEKNVKNVRIVSQAT